MHVLMLNGSPRANGCTNRALVEIARTLEAEGITSEIFQMGAAPIAGCTACRACDDLDGCAIKDGVNDFVKLAAKADGFVFGTPVYFASPNGSVLSFMDRAFFSADDGHDGPFSFKPAAAICSARRAGTSAALDAMNKYFSIMNMPIAPSCYWNMVHGNTPEEVERDEEGLQIMRQLARNIAWMIKCRAAADAAGVKLPTIEERVRTNFIR